MSTTVLSALCGARRPGWEQGPAIGINRIPCILPAGHEGEHGNAFGQTWPATAPLTTALLLLADCLHGPPTGCGHDRGTAPRPGPRHRRPAAPGRRAERELLALLPTGTGQIRGEYAALLRIAAEEIRAMSTPSKPGKRMSIRVDNALSGDLAALIKTGLTASDAVRLAVGCCSKSENGSKRRHLRRWMASGTP
ncbi:hypothetical protein [Streptomyces sp. NPDC059247]|uniref:hypothetical protein n=1 Tax=Streptomyces sp. NPDC059247 TaxID=3346790 RepID=UPI0036B01480